MINMNRILKIFLSLIFIFILSGCQKHGVKQDIKLLDNNNSYYNWIYSIDDESIVKMVDEKYYGEENNDEINGLGGEYIFTIQTLKPGKTRINFSYVISWDKTDEIYNYYIDVEVSEDLELKITYETGNYLALLKFLKLEKEVLGLNNTFDNYKFYFSDDPVNYKEYECYRLSVYDYEDNAIGYYAISSSNDYIFKVVDGEYILLNED